VVKYKFEFVKTTGLVLHWLVLLTLLTIQLLGIVSSIGTSTPFLLGKGGSAEVTVFRLYPTPLHFSLEFNKKKGSIRSELGSGKYTNPKNGAIRFDDPSETIKILAASELGTQIYEMFPSGYLLGEKDDSIAKRTFYPFVEDNDPAAYPWPPANELRPVLPVGFSILKFSVTDTGDVFKNENVIINIAPPIEPKTVHTHDYMWLSWATILWPFNLVALGVYGWYLIWKTRKMAKELQN